ncbi:MAG: alpha-ketoacid dehydrogenase subunit beta, partial [Acetobacteraceae bacterium]
MLIRASKEARAEGMAPDPRVILFIEDVEIPIMGDRRGLHPTCGADRVRDTPIREAVMTGMSVGAAAAPRPICRVMSGNVLHPRTDAIANRAAKLRHRTGGRMKQPAGPPGRVRER